MMTENARFVEQADVAWVYPSQTVAAPSSSKWFDLDRYERCTIIIKAVNGSASIVPAVTLSQAQDDAGTGVEAFTNFSDAYRTLDVATNKDALTNFTVSSGTFTLDSTSGKDNLYVIELRPSDLDLANNMKALRVNLSTASNISTDIEVLLWPAKYGRQTNLSAEP